MKKATKIMALVIAVVMLAGTLCGCGGSKQAREKGKYTYWSTVVSSAQQTISSYEDMQLYQELCKRTGVEVDFIHPTAGSTGSEAFQILLTSTDMPDMVEYSWKNYPGGADAAINNKVIISLNDYLEEYAPNYYSYVGENGEKNIANGGLYKAQAMTQEGNYYGFNNLNIGQYRGFSGIYIRKDLLDKWGVEVPVTIDDWTNVLATAKANGIKYPLTGTKSLFDISGTNLFNTAWEVGKTFHVEDGKIVFAPGKAAYKEYVKTMADWMKKGYVDPDYITNDTTALQAAITSTKSIVSNGFVGSGLGRMLPAMEGNAEYPDFSLVACTFPVMNEGDKAWFQEIQGEAIDPAIAITTSCGAKDEERYKEAIKFCDYLYSEEGMVLKSFGIEGKTFTKTEKKPEEIGPDGEKYKYTYTAAITDRAEQEKIGAHSVEAALFHYMRPANCPGLNQHPDYLEGFYPYQEQKDAFKIWNTHIDEARKHVLPPFTLTNEETTRKNEIQIKALDTLNAAISNIILGKADISTFDSAVAKAKKDGYDELTQINQTALDRYYKLLEK